MARLKQSLERQKYADLPKILRCLLSCASKQTSEDELSTVNCISSLRVLARLQTMQIRCGINVTHSILRGAWLFHGTEGCTSLTFRLNIDFPIGQFCCQANILSTAPNGKAELIIGHDDFCPFSTHLG
jgi:hypothetical protein